MLYRNVPRKFMHEVSPAHKAASRLGGFSFPHINAREQQPKAKRIENQQMMEHLPAHPFPHRLFALPSEQMFAHPQDFLNHLQEQASSRDTQRSYTPSSKAERESTSQMRREPNPRFQQITPKGDPQMTQVFQQLFGANPPLYEHSSTVTKKPSPDANTMKTHQLHNSMRDATLRQPPPSQQNPVATDVSAPSARLQELQKPSRRAAIFEGTPSESIASPDALCGSSILSEGDGRVQVTPRVEPTLRSSAPAGDHQASAADTTVLRGIKVKAADYLRVRDVTICGLPPDSVLDGEASSAAGRPTLSLELDEIKHVIRIVVSKSPSVVETATPERPQVLEERYQLESGDPSVEITTQLTEQPPVYHPGQCQWRCEIPVPPTTTLSQITPFFSSTETENTLRLAIQKPVPVSIDAETYTPKRITLRREA